MEKHIAEIYRAVVFLGSGRLSVSKERRCYFLYCWLAMPRVSGDDWYFKADQMICDYLTNVDNNK
jgi:hypothetical protein